MKIFIFISVIFFSELQIICQRVDNKVFAIYVDEFGSQWFGTNNYLLRKTESDWIAYSLPEIQARINDIKKSPGDNSALWIATNHGIISFNYDSQKIFNIHYYDSLTTTFRTNDISSILFNKSETGYFITSKGIGIYNSTGWRFYTHLIDVVKNEFTSAGIKNDTVYFGTRGEGVARIFGKADTYSGASSYVRPWSALPNDTINCMLIDSNGNQWYGTNKGLCRHYNTEAKEAWDLYYVRHITNGKVTSLSEDREGNIWAGTTGGLSKIAPDLRKIELWRKNDGLTCDSIYTLFPDADNVLIGTENGVLNFHNSTFNRISFPDPQNIKHLLLPRKP